MNNYPVYSICKSSVGLCFTSLGIVRKVSVYKPMHALLLHGAIALLFSGCATSSRVSPKQIEDIGVAAQKVLPAGVKVYVRKTEYGIHSMPISSLLKSLVVFVKTLEFPIKPDITISAYLLEESAEDERHPDIRDSTNLNASLVQLRCARILRSIVAMQQIPDADNVYICAIADIHEVEGYSSKYTGKSSLDTIYVVKMPVTQMREINWSELNNRQIMERLKVIRNYFPWLRFKVVD